MRGTKLLGAAYLLSALGLLRELYLRDSMAAFFVMIPVLVAIWNAGLYFIARVRSARNFLSKTKGAIRRLEQITENLEGLSDGEREELKDWFKNQGLEDGDE